MGYIYYILYILNSSPNAFIYVTYLVVIHIVDGYFKKRANNHTGSCSFHNFICIFIGPVLFFFGSNQFCQKLMSLIDLQNYVKHRSIYHHGVNENICVYPPVYHSGHIIIKLNTKLTMKQVPISMFVLHHLCLYSFKECPSASQSL